MYDIIHQQIVDGQTTFKSNMQDMANAIRQSVFDDTEMAFDLPASYTGGQ
jgi:hypothetical protein